MTCCLVVALGLGLGLGLDLGPVGKLLCTRIFVQLYIVIFTDRVQTYTAVVWLYWLRTGPTEGLSSWWLSNRSSPENQQWTLDRQSALDEPTSSVHCPPAGNAETRASSVCGRNQKSGFRGTKRCFNVGYYR